jgi:uncharacterized membrane protein
VGRCPGRWRRRVSDTERDHDAERKSPDPDFRLPGVPVELTPQPAVLQTALQLQIHQGPLPPAQELKALEAVHPGATAWLLEEAKISSAHVRAMEAQVLRYKARDALLHRVLPFCLVAMLLAISALMAIFANAYVGGFAFVSTLAGVVTAYLKGAMDGDKAPSQRGHTT